MPEGSFVILLPTDSDYKILGYFFKEGTSKFEITSELFLRLNLDHSKKEYNVLKLKDFTFISYIHKLSGKLSRKASGMIIGLLLDESDDAEKFRIPLKKMAETLSALDLLKMSKKDFEANLKVIYEEQLEKLSGVLSQSALKYSIIDRSKELLSGGKKARKKTRELLKKLEDKVHSKISDFYKAAEDALKESDYEKAIKFFNKAAEVAEKLLQNDLAQILKERADLAKKIPSLRKGLTKLVQDARNYLKNERFNAAYRSYREAAEYAKELMLSDEEEEYRLKSKALQDFYQVDERFKKKK